MNYIYAIESMNNVLSHHGTKGQKWGVRRYQNSDGSLTDAGKKRYGYGLKEGSIRYEQKRQKAYNDTIKNENKAFKKSKKAEDKWEKFQRNEQSYSDKKRNKLWDKLSQEREKANSNYWKQWKDNKALLKELNMGKTEQEYRKANNISKILENEKRARRFAESYKQRISSINKKSINFINQYRNSSLNTFNQQINQQNTQMFINQSIRDANMTASLGMSGGTNPFMF